MNRNTCLRDEKWWIDTVRKKTLPMTLSHWSLRFRSTIILMYTCSYSEVTESERSNGSPHRALRNRRRGLRCSFSGRHWSCSWPAGGDVVDPELIQDVSLKETCDFQSSWCPDVSRRNGMKLHCSTSISQLSALVHKSRGVALTQNWNWPINIANTLKFLR